MKKVFMFKNLRTGQVKNFEGEGGLLGDGLEKAIQKLLTVEGWEVSDMRFLGSRALPTDTATRRNYEP